MSIVSASSRPIALERRRDLLARPLWFAGRRAWGVKDPISLRYFQLREEEYELWQMLDGRASLDELKERFDAEHPDAEMEIDQVHAFLGRLHRDGLVLSTASDQGTQLWQSRTRRRRRQFWMTLASPLAIRFRGWDADRALGWMAARCGWLFSRWMMFFCAIIGLAALIVAGTHARELAASMPDVGSFFTGRGALWLLATLAVVKMLHELGHGLSCKRWGGECHELGLMLLVGAPCLYCDVSGAWMLPSKWQRIAIGAAGMVVELMLAAVCTLLWWASEPGLLHSLCINVMIVCTVNTLLLNGNPLLRYDGYYILADLIEVPNLHEQSDGVLRHAVGDWLWGSDEPADRTLPETGWWWLALYALASLVYRVLVAVMAVWLMSRMLTKYRLDTVTHLIALVVAAGLVVPPAVKLVSMLRSPARMQQVRWSRALPRWLLAMAVLAGIALAPLPHHVMAPVYLDVDDATAVYVTAPGTLVDAVPEGDAVESGQLLARLENLELDREVAKLRGQRDVQSLHVRNLEAQQVRDAAAGTQLPTAKEMLADLNERLAAREREQARLKLTAPTAGTVLPPPAQHTATAPHKLATWTGTPLEDRNRGALLVTGTLLCRIGDPSRLVAVAVIDENDVALVRPEQPVQLLLDQASGTVLSGTVRSIAPAKLETAPRELTGRGELALRSTSPGEPQAGAVPSPRDTLYEARIDFNTEALPLLTGTAGRAKIRTAPQSLLARSLRMISATFRFTRD